jgi:hypothetical protein
VFGSAGLASCTTTSTSLVQGCGPDNSATTAWDVAAITNYEAAWYYAAVDPFAFGTIVVADVPVAYTPPVPVPVPTPVVDASFPAPTPVVDASFPPIFDAGIVPKPPPVPEAGIILPLLDAGVSAASAAAASMAAAAVGRYFPNGCATATASGNVVTYQFNNCSGPFGMLGATGTLTATLNVVDDSVQVQLAGNHVASNGGTLNVNTSGTVRPQPPGQKTLQATSQSTGTGPQGNNVAHTGSYTVQWPTPMAGCATINGTLAGTGPEAGTNTVIANYIACTGKCPQAGTVTTAFEAGTATITFTGSDIAECNATNGTSASIPFNCP